MIEIQLKRNKEQALKRRHPWIFSGALAPMRTEPEDGSIVRVVDSKGNYIASGHYHRGSIAVRILSYGDEDLMDLGFWKKKLTGAWQTRRRIGLLGVEHTTCFRIVHGEGDGLSGLIVDGYNRTAVLQCHSIGMHRQRDLIAQALIETSEGHLEAVYDKSHDALPRSYAAAMKNGFLIGEGMESTIVLENDDKFKIDFVTGQKTGFFLDQRDNRALLALYAEGKSVLNTFCYTGGFSIAALNTGAAAVTSVDVSSKAMDLTAENVELNKPFSGKHIGHTADVLKYFKTEENLYDIVVVDPPAFAKSLKKRHNAVQGYKRLNAAAIQRIKPGGLLFTFSCSQVVDRALFNNTITAAAIEAGRPAKVLHYLGQGADHPVSLFHPEGHYLKGLVVLVE